MTLKNSKFTNDDSNQIQKLMQSSHNASTYIATIQTTFRIKCANLQDAITRDILSNERYTNIRPFTTRYVAMGVLMLQDTMRYRTVPVLMNHPDAYPHLVLVFALMPDLRGHQNSHPSNTSCWAT